VKLWLTSAEIADLALPGLPTTKRNVNALAEREGWAAFAGLSRPRKGQGGGLEYHIDLLPVPARIAYLGTAASNAAADAVASAAGGEVQAAPEPAEGTTAGAGLQRDARLAILGAFAQFARETGLQQALAASYFPDLYNAGKGAVPEWARQTLPRLSTRSLLRWLSAKREGDTQRLAVDRGAARRGSGVFEAAFGGEIKQFALAVHSFNELYTARQIHETLQQEFGARLAAIGLALPGQRAFEVKFKAWKRDYEAGLLRMMDPDAYASKMRVSGGYAHLVGALNELWQIDASPVDALCVDGRHSIYACIDIWSRRIIMLVSKTPRSEAVQLLMRKAILAWGVPDAVKTDNGSDFVARASVRLFAALGIEAIRSAAFSPWQKGVVERAIGTFQSDCAGMLTGFVGHNVAQRKRIEGRKAFAQRLGSDDKDLFSVTMTGEDLQGLVDRWAQTIYAMHPHGGIGRMTPFARAASSTRVIRTVAPEALASLLMPAPDSHGIRTVGKRGIRVGGFDYLVPGQIVGARLFVRMDPADKGFVWCFDEAGETFLGKGTCPELSGVDPAALIAETKALQKRAIDEQMAEVKAMTRKRVTERTVLDSRMARAAAATGNLVAFPQRSEAHTTPALDAGLEVAAMRRGDAPVAAPLSDAAQRVHRELLDAHAAPVGQTKVTPLRQSETPRQRFRRAAEIEAAIAAGDPVSTEQALWLGSYQTSAEYRAEKAMREEFGEAALR
jgi:transposase InsO family protein